MTVRIAMWSGPRNLSTALMRSFGNRGDCHVVDEPLYAHYLAATGLDHPLRDQVIASQPTAWEDAVAALEASRPEALQYEKHMTHHLLPGLDRAWVLRARNAFLIRRPGPVLRSYVASRASVTLEDVGYPQQVEIFDRVCDALGHAPPVVDADDVRRDPRATLTALCDALGVPFTDRMLSWPAGPRATDGVWAPAWYRSVEASTGFALPDPEDPTPLPPELADIAARAEPLYERLRAHVLR